MDGGVEDDHGALALKVIDAAKGFDHSLDAVIAANANSPMPVPQFSTNQLVVWGALLLGLLVALLLGSAVGGSDFRLITIVLVTIPVLILFARLNIHIWVLMPLGWYLTGGLPWLPLPFTIRNLCFLISIIFFALFFATRVVPWKRKLDALDYLIYINLAYLATVFVRNPVGFWAMQSSMVGGRPYFEIVLAFGGFIILSRVNPTEFIAKVFPLFFVVPTWIVAGLGLISQLIPQFADPLARIYNGVGSTSVASALDSESSVGESRFSGMQFAGLNSVLALCAKYNPITLISPLYPFRVFLLLIAFGAVFLAGYRSTFLFTIAVFFLSSLLQKRARDLWLAGGGMILILVLIISIQGSVIQFPRTMQRALSWLPGDWSEEVLGDTENSSRWRFEMWRWAWNDERILRDRVWGQGFGLSLDDMNLIAESMLAGQSGATYLGGSDRENFMITGSFHSGPLSAIKYIGLFGLCLYYPLMCYMALVAWRLCRRAYGTRAFTLALFVGIPIIYEPFNFVFIFGGLDGNYPQLLFWAGLLNMTSRYTDAVITASNSKSIKDEAQSHKIRAFAPAIV